ncbi:hypothetical protein COT77_01910 [Candidatus Berkelbacteria bacterium CG10_big_fil_rev_8_21_14_0_10_41_12]|uniref:Sortase n=1 Tax=Candidatus Berkelbacteria bacterium CG10_big_fil_rev_8_21_14_0_10_41_12 TaxID=1974513 RepID=A0A2M6WX27_9BACT|nr:MAG: hypothetical protein COT77_01910 [Candidatus Berkelbacteria bacterium CG10_big_fil_rev_8_21_14_0_10_41_12]
MVRIIDGVGYTPEELVVHKSRRNFLAKRIAGFFIELIFFSSVVFVLINFPAYLKIIKFNLDPQSFVRDFGIQEEIALQARVQNKPDSDKADGQAEQKTKEHKSNFYKLEDNHIYIEKIGVSAPIVWDVESDQIADKLSQGVVHISGSSKPDKDKNTFLTGHSSNYWWDKGDYNTVFALLPSLEKENKIVITYRGVIYKYKVVEKKEVTKKEVENYIDLPQKKSLTIMTCVPVGTNLRRLIIIATPEV